MGVELFQVLEETLYQAQEALDDMRESGIEYARAKRDYRKALAAEMLRLRRDGKPATLIPDVARGCDRVADLCFERDCAQIGYETARETLLLRKKDADTLREQISREWSQA